MNIDEKIIEENKILIEKYPFLLPRNRWSGEVPDDYDYSYTELDAMPIGWKKAFGELICEDLKNELIKSDLLNEYRILEIKEKYGTLRWDDNGHTKEIRDIFIKYEYLSQFVCIFCGKFGVSTFDDGWVSPYCDKCFIDMRYRRDVIFKRELGEKIEDKPFNETELELLRRFRLEDEEFNPIIKIESMGKDGCSWRELDLTDILERMNVNCLK